LEARNGHNTAASQTYREGNADVQENNKEEENQENKNKEEIKEVVKHAEEKDRY